MSEDVLNVQVGTVLQIQATTPERSPRHNVKLIGYLPGAGFIVTTPTVNGKIQIIREGQRYNVRMLRGNTVMGFVTQVLQSSVKPYPHLHMEYPKEVESIMVRNAARVAAGIFAVVRNTKDPDEEGHEFEVSILDLSSTGAKIGAGKPLGEVGDTLLLTFAIEVTGCQETMALLGDLRNHAVREDEATGEHFYNHGLQFRGTNRFQQVLLHSWVMERLLADDMRSG